MILRRKKKDNMVNVDVGPFADIAFLLIIFFILTTTFVKDTGTMMQIPQGDPDAVTSDDKKVPTILLMPGEMRVDNQAMTMSGLQKWLDEKKFGEKDPNDRVIILESEENVSYQIYYSVVSMVNKAGGTIALMTDDGSES